MRPRRSSVTPEGEALQFLKEKQDKDGFVVRQTTAKGRGVFTTKPFKQGDFLLIYDGELVSGDEGERREREEGESGFRYFFSYSRRNWCIDATMEPPDGMMNLGRLVNHGTRRERNAKIKAVLFDEKPALCIFALRDLETNEEVLYDYGVKEKCLPWNKKEEELEGGSKADCVSEISSGDPKIVQQESKESELVSGFEQPASNYDSNPHSEKSKTSPDGEASENGNVCTTSLTPDVNGTKSRSCEDNRKVLDNEFVDTFDISEVLSDQSNPGCIAHSGKSNKNDDSVSISDKVISDMEASNEARSNPSIDMAAANLGKRGEPDVEKIMSKSGNDFETVSEEFGDVDLLSLLEGSCRHDSGSLLVSDKLNNVVPDTEAPNNGAVCSSKNPVCDMDREKEQQSDRNVTGISDKSGYDPEKVSEEVNDCDSLSLCEKLCSDSNPVFDNLNIFVPDSEVFDSGASCSNNLVPAPEAVKRKRCDTELKGALEKPVDDPEEVPKTSGDLLTISGFAECSNDRGYISHSDKSDSVVPDSETSDSGSTVYSPIPIPDMKAARVLRAAKEMRGCRYEQNFKTANKESSDLAGPSSYSESSSDCDSVSNDQDFVPDSEESESDHECSSNSLNDRRATKLHQKVTKKSSGSKGLKANISGISVMPTANERGKRNWDKPHYCLFCLTPQKKLPRHLQSIHGEEVKVQRWLATKDKQDRASQMSLMRNYGNYLHNDAVIREGKGVLIVIYRPSYTVEPKDYLPCSECFGYYAKDDMWKHRCPCKKSTNQLDDEAGQPQPKKKRVAHCKPSRMLLPPTPGVSQRTHEIMLNMNNDDVSLLCKTDSLIKMYADKMTERHGHDNDLSGYIRQKIREVGRMVLQYRSLTGQPSAQLCDILCPKNFDDAILATKLTAGFEEGTNLYKTPSLALKIGHGLKTCTEILRGKALVNGDESVVQQCKGFLELYELQWEDKISHHALRTLKEGRRNNPKLLPLTEDVVKMTKYLQMQVKERQEHLLRKISANQLEKVSGAWSKLAEVLLAQIVIFNRKRPGEVSKMLVEDYKKCASGEDAIIDSALSKWEVALCKCLWRVEIVGKGGNTVVVLLTAKMKEAMDILVKKREAAGVESNHFLFCNQSGNGHLRACDAIREHSKLCQATHPENLRATKLRKHIATVSQIMNLQENELDILAKFLGHDVRTHRQYYRLPESTIQVAKVSEVLLKMESGDLQGLSGKSLEDIQLDPSEECSSDADNSDFSESNFSETEEPTGDAETATASNPGPSNVELVNEKVNRGQEDNNQRVRRPWTSKQKAAVAKNLRKHLVSRKLPGKRQIEALITAEPAVFADRSWRNVKDFVRNQIRKKNPLSFES